MKIDLKRYSDNGESTLGLLFVNNKFFCYTIEDTYRKVKVKHETRIPEGEYKVTLRNAGGMTGRYAKKFPGIHKGMLWIREIPNFEYVYFHMGNDKDDSSGCILTADMVNNNTVKDGFAGESRLAYTRFYKEVVKALDAGEEVVVSIESM